MPNKSKSQPQTKSVHRSSNTGKFVTEKYAERRPATTEKEQVSTGTK
jgi:hypothetical protein